ncbi:DUF397 domain-containing protein [Amycolatopsis minnesotensis]|uniref:DUF397 domain-containing protein n=1 Tax=Amycolatopsis minnesotensis TaxID=337894 RepID=A0ABN2QHZ4_9PSEU
MADSAGSRLRRRGEPTPSHTPGDTALTWNKSSYRNESGQDCVEATELGVGAAVRDAKAPSAGHLAVRPAAWSAFPVSADLRMP